MSKNKLLGWYKTGFLRKSTTVSMIINRIFNSISIRNSIAAA